MTLRYAVGIKIRNKTDQVTVEAEDALIAALKVKTAHPEAAITYVRKQNARGDRRHPHASQIDKKPAGPATPRTAQSQSSLESVCGTIAEATPDPMHKPPGRSLDEEDEAEIRTPPEIVPERPPPPAPWERPQGSRHHAPQTKAAAERGGRPKRSTQYPWSSLIVHSTGAHEGPLICTTPVSAPC